MKKILVINVNWLGDVIFSTPALKALRSHYPYAHIGCLVIARCEEVLKNSPRVNEIIVYDEYGKHRSLWAKFKFIRYVRGKKFDEVYIFHPALRRAMIGFLAGIPRRIGYSTKGRACLLTDAIPPPDELVHKIDYFLNILHARNIKADDRVCEFFLSRDDEKEGQQILRNAGVRAGERFVVINPGGNWAMKCWPAINFGKVADFLIERSKVKVVIVGAKKDIPLAQEIAHGMQQKPAIIAGQTTLHQLGAVMKRSGCVVSADSGPMHIAVAVGTDTVAIFGPTSSRLTGPVGKGEVVILQKDVGCEIPCYETDCADNRCMREITPQEVYNHVCMFLGRRT